MRAETMNQGKPEMGTTNPSRRATARGAGRAGIAALAAAALALAGCDLTAPSPAQIEDADIRDPIILNALLTGAESDYGRGLTQNGGGGVVIAGGLLVDELVHSGSWVGLQGPSWGLAGDHWVEAQSRWAEPSRARWTTEHAISLGREIIGDVLDEDPDAHPGIARITFFAGMAHRTLADNFCNVVYDSGPLQPYTDGYPRALEHYEDAIMRANNRIQALQNDPDPELDPAQIETAVQQMEDLITASRGAMAQTYLIMASEGMGAQYWDQAVAMAAQVPTNFVWAFPMSSGGRNSNRIPAWTRSRTETTMWQTPFADWGLDVENPEAGGDPRIAYEAPTEDGEFVKAYDNRRPAYLQRKFTSSAGDLPLVKGTEMRLIEAEAALIDGDWQTVVDKINEIRDYHNLMAPSWWIDALGPDPLPHVSAENLEEGWFLLMKERGIELYLEGRRVADIRRWQTTPGRDMVPFHVVRRDTGEADPWTDPLVWVYERELGETVIPPHEMCLQVSRDEKASNPNIDG